MTGRDVGALVLGVLFCSLLFAGYERLNGGPWYTYVTFDGDRRLLGADKRVTFMVTDESGKPIDIIAGWDYPDAPPNSTVIVRDSSGKDHWRTTYIPAWLQIAQAVLSPFLWLGRLVIDGVIGSLSRLPVLHRQVWIPTGGCLGIGQGCL